jgi:hypothetical protein
MYFFITTASNKKNKSVSLNYRQISTIAKLYPVAEIAYFPFIFLNIH